MCDSTKLSYFDAIRPSKLKLHAHKRPEWFQTFIEQTDPGKPLRAAPSNSLPVRDFRGDRKESDPKVIDTIFPKFQKHLCKRQFFTKATPSAC